MKNIVGYIHSTEGHLESCSVQKDLIQEYCQMQKIQLDEMFIDNGNLDSYVEAGDTTYKLPQRKKGFSARRELLRKIQAGEIGCILVDSILRLTVNSYETQEFMEWCKKQHVTVIEVNLYNGTDETKQCKVAVYHFTDGSTIRPRVVEQAIDELYECASSHNDWKLYALYLDRTLVKTEQTEYEKMKMDAERFDIIMVKDFYHIRTKTSTFWNHAIQFLKKGISIYSLLDGNLDSFYDVSWQEKDLEVAAYYRCMEETREHNLRIDSIKIYAELKTNWKIKRIYVDSMEKYSDKQPELERLVTEISKYDLIMVDSFGSIHFRTAKFMKIKKQIGKPIFSIKEGGILL